ncbi:Hpt domain-containing protein [Photobacterium satsumensis]|uniref:Hpt domain-containing protein n=1 Tax=Photobacterium satsumensis TaxID=2910239 RepID=UPI003D0E4DE2
MKKTSGKRAASTSQSHSSTKSLIGIALIVAALPSLYLGISLSGVLGNALIVFSVMALVAALGIGSSFLLKPKDEESGDPKTVSESLLETNPNTADETLSLSTEVESLTVFDSDYLLDTMDGDRDMVTMLLEVFVDEHFDDGHKIVKALQAGDIDQVQMLSHSLKGVSASLGTEQIHALAEQVEREVKTQADSEKLENLCELLKMVFTPAALEIQSFLDEGAKIQSLKENHKAALSQMVPSQHTSTQETFTQETLTQETLTQETSVSGAVSQEIPQQDKSTIVSRPVKEEIVDVVVSDSGSIQEQTQEESSDNGAEPEGWLDVNALREAMDGDEETVCMLLEIFIEDNAGKGQVLVAAVSEAGQQEHALNIVHALKGVAANLSAEPLRRCCGVAETKFKNNEPVSVEECREIEMVLNQTIASAEAYLAKTTIGV